MKISTAAFAVALVPSAMAVGASSADAASYGKSFSWTNGGFSCTGDISGWNGAGTAMGDVRTTCDVHTVLLGHGATRYATLRVTLRAPNGTLTTKDQPLTNSLGTHYWVQSMTANGAALPGTYSTCVTFRNPSGTAMGRFSNGATGVQACSSGMIK